MKNIPNGYHVSRCYDTDYEALAGARVDFERWATELRSATT